MARRAVVIEKSPTMQKILAGVIMAHHNDILVVEAPDCRKAEEIIRGRPCQLVIYHWDTVSDDYRDLLPFLRSREIPLLVIGPEPGSPGEEELLAAGLHRQNMVPCYHHEVVRGINRVCNPVALRQTTRYNIPGTIARLCQGETIFYGAVIDISMGGMLCDIEYSADFQWDRPNDVEVDFPDGDRIMTASGITGIVRRLVVIEENDDRTPLILRIAMAYTAMPEAAAEIYRSAMSRAEELARCLPCTSRQ